MSMDLREIWQDCVGGLVSEETAQNHLLALDEAGENVEALWHCNLYDGLFDGIPAHMTGLDNTVFSLLEAAEKAGRNIVLINTASDIGVDDFANYCPNKDWELKPRLSTGREFFERARGNNLKKAEVIISRHSRQSMPMDHKAHLTVIHPNSLVRN